MNLYGHKINQAARKFAKRLNERLAPLDLHNAQWAVILCLHERGSCTQKELSDYLSVEAPTMTRTLMRIEEKGWIIREEGVDRREKKVRLSAGVHKRMDLWKQESDELERIALENIDPKDLAVFDRVLQQMMRNLDA